MRQKRAGIYICLFSNGTIKVGRGLDMEARKNSHASIGSAFFIELDRFHYVACDNHGKCEAALISWCVTNCMRQARREWFMGLDYEACVNVANEIGAADMGPHLPAMKKISWVEKFIEKACAVTSTHAAYIDAKNRLATTSIFSSDAWLALDFLHDKCERIRFLRVGVPQWFEDLNTWGDWEVEMFFLEGPQDSSYPGFARALSGAFDVMRNDHGVSLQLL